LIVVVKPKIAASHLSPRPSRASPASPPYKFEHADPPHQEVDRDRGGDHERRRPQERVLVVGERQPPGVHAEHARRRSADRRRPRDLGFPKKYAHPKLEIVKDTLTAYGGQLVAMGTMGYKARKHGRQRRAHHGDALQNPDQSQAHTISLPT